MAERPHPDPQTLEEVHELLTTTDFASIHDLVDRTDAGALGDAAVTSRTVEQVVGSDDRVPLPRRR